MIYEAESDAEISRCYPVMQQLRSHVAAADFVAIVRRQMDGGYRLACLEEAGGVQAVSGFRVIENLVGGRVLYVDDLVTDAAARSRGHGKHLFDWLVARARAEACAFLEPDSGVQRFDAHRFYFVNRMVISSHHFRLPL